MSCEFCACAQCTVHSAQCMCKLCNNVNMVHLMRLWSLSSIDASGGGGRAPLPAEEGSASALAAETPGGVGALDLLCCDGDHA